MLAMQALGAKQKGDSKPELHLVTAARAAFHGAYCLDGTLPGYWHDAPATPSSDWLLFLDGGAWCYDAQSCEARSREFRGSSRHFPSRYWPYSGPMSANPTLNPAFAGFHRVVLGYCDGGSWLGDRHAPLLSGGRPLYLRGKRVLDAIIDELLATTELKSAARVLWSGGSAGGLGALAAANRVHEKLAAARVYKVMVLSGFFLQRGGAADGVEDGGLACAGRRRAAPGAAEPSPACLPWVTKMRRMYDLHNASSGVSAECAAARPAAERWKCVFAAPSAAAVRAPLYVINSALDSWQLVNVWRRFPRCRYADARNCSADAAAADVAELNGMVRTFVEDLRVGLGGTPDPMYAAPRAGSGAFIETCNEHIAGLAPGGYRGYQIGGERMRDALASWWAAPPDAPAKLLLPCELQAGKGRDSGCNPTCAEHRMKRRLNQECACDPPP